MEIQKRIMANRTLGEKEKNPPLVQNKTNISNESFKELYKRVCATLKDSGFDMEDVVYPFPDLNDFNRDSPYGSENGSKQYKQISLSA